MPRGGLGGQLPEADGLDLILLPLLGPLYSIVKLKLVTSTVSPPMVSSA
jgi:hypothetical protein